MTRQLNFIYLIQSFIKYLSTSRKQIIIRGKNDPDVKKKKRRIRIKNINKTRGLSRPNNSNTKTFNIKVKSLLIFILHNI